MFSKKLYTLLAICACASQAPFASAQITEVRVGLTEFDERTTNINEGRFRANENSAAINAEILFQEPQFLKWALSPQPYIGATINLEGKTSYGGAGLLWRKGFGEKFYGDFSFGLVAHNGTLDIERAPGQSFFDILDRFENEIEFGTTVLFREQIALGYNVSDEWSAELFYEHLSNAGLAAENDGANNLGFRAVKKF